MNSSTDVATLQTRGIKRNRNGMFKLELTGEDVYRLLQLLEDRAVAETAYLEVRQSVYFADKLREQAREQGF